MKTKVVSVVVIIGLLCSGAWGQVTSSKGSGRWGAITGTITDQTDLVAALGGVNIPSGTEFGYVKGVTSAIQTQLNGKMPVSMAGYSALADHGYLGFTNTGTAGEALAIGNVVYLKAADSRWWKAKADVSTTMSATPMIAVSTAAGAGSSVTLLEWGYFRDDTLSLTTNGASVYVSRTTAGLITGTAPSTVGDQVQIIGEVTDVDNIIKFNPSQLLLEVGSGLTLPLSGTIATSATPYPSSDGTATGTQVEFFTITALGAAAELQIPVGTPTNGQRLMVRIKDDGTARALTYNAIYRASSDLALPATTTLGKTLYLNFIYNSAANKWDFIGYLDNF